MTVFNTCYGNINELWAALIFEELSRWGVTHCCIGPGSRSAPLALAAAAHPGIQTLTHYDERGLGYLALGLAKTGGQPVAVLTTSGTAAANLYPAVIEAANTGVALIVLSADRPPELLDCGANQAIDQNRLFGHYPSYYAQLPCPAEDIAGSMVLTTLDQALARSRDPEPGPVHLNLYLREPLYPDGQLRDFAQYLSELTLWGSSRSPYTDYRRAPPLALPRTQAQRLAHFLDGNGLVIAGRIDCPADARAILELAQALDWPVLPDIQSQLRFTEGTIRCYDLLLNNDGFRHALGRSDRVLQFGGRLTSRRLGRWLGSRDWRDYWFIDRSGKREDPHHRIRYRLSEPMASFCDHTLELLAERGAPRRPRSPEFVHYNRQLEQWLTQWLQRWQGDGSALNEIFVARAVVERQSAPGTLFAGNSLPIRLLDMFASGSEHPLTVYGNRGASGIDGILATAVGCTLTGRQPVTVLLGDLSLLHDLSSLGLLRQVHQPLVVVLLNNDGGGIFRMLPVPRQDNLLERYFQLPHGFSFGGACEMFGVAYACPESRQAFTDCYTLALQKPRATVIEAKVPPGQAAHMIQSACREIGAIRFTTKAGLERERQYSTPRETR